jgi:hypothetical protein
VGGMFEGDSVMVLDGLRQRFEIPNRIASELLDEPQYKGWIVFAAQCFQGSKGFHISGARRYRCQSRTGGGRSLGGRGLHGRVWCPLLHECL